MILLHLFLFLSIFKFLNFYNDNISSFEKLLKKDNSFSVQHMNTQSSTIELFKIKYNISNRTM